MKNTKSIVIKVCALMSLSLLLVPSLATKLQAQNMVAATFEPPPGQDAPTGGTAGGASRPVKNCRSNLPADQSSLTPLSPGNKLGLTQRDRPILFVYLPQTSAKTAEFSLFDEKKNGIYQVILPVTNQAGFISINLPNNAPKLAKDKLYYWTFALVCNEDDRTEDSVVGGWIKYSQPDAHLNQKLTNAALLDRIELYAKNGFWYDAITMLIAQKQKESNNVALAKSWAELLQSVGLEAIATQPFSAVLQNDIAQQISW